MIEKLCMILDFSRSDSKPILDKLKNKFDSIEILKKMEELKEKSMEYRHDTIVCVIGGDGSVRRVAEYIIDNGLDLPILGIAGGTANVGPLIRFNLHKLDFLDKTSMFIYPVDAIEIFSNGKRVGYSFIDVILSSFFVNPTEDKVKNLDPHSFMNGSIRKGEKKRIGDEETQFFRNSHRLKHKLKTIKQIIISVSNPNNRFAGRLISGVCAWTAFFKHSAVLTIAEDYILDADLRKERVTSMDFLHIEQVLFDLNDEIKIENLKDETALILDGDLCALVGSNDTVKIKIVEDIVKVVSNLPKFLDLAPIGDVGRLH